MKNSYEILGVSLDTSIIDIKKAYFTLIRQYSPERDPLKFQEIRAAYEQIKDGPKGAEPQLTKDAQPIVHSMYQYMVDRWLRGDYVSVANMAAEALHLFPKELVFQYYLCKSYIQLGYTGKAVKEAEVLTKKMPDMAAYRFLLANAYKERKYNKKAVTAYQQAFNIGEGSLDDLVSYAGTLDSQGQRKKAKEILYGIIEKEQRWKKEDFVTALDIYAGVWTMSSKDSEESLTHIVGLFLEFSRRYSAWLEEYHDTYISVYVFYSVVAYRSSKAMKNMLEELKTLVQKSMRSEESRQMLKVTTNSMWASILRKDERIYEELRYGVEIWMPEIYENDWFGEDVQMNKFKKLDFKLCVLEQMPEVLSHLTIIEQEYPFYFEKIQEFAETLRQGKNLAYLKQRLLKDYIRLSTFISGGHYKRLYPDFNKGMGTDMWMEENPYVRDGKKVGRNDPCPCGSNKKYKQCCGKN